MMPRIRILLSIFLCLGFFALISSCSPPAPSEPVDYLRIYSKVLENKLKFAGFKEAIYWKDYHMFNYSPEKIYLTVIDLDADGMPEVVLGFQPGILLILHYENGSVFGFERGIREMNELKKDGTFYWSGGAGYHGYGKMLFSEGKCETINLAVLDFKSPEDALYRINNNEVS